MKAAQISSYGGPDVVEITDVSLPTVSEESVLVSIQAAGVNPVDWKIREGYLNAMAPLTFPATLGGDFAGVVEEVGSKVTTFQKGDEVYGSALSLGSGSGAFAEMASVLIKAIAKKPTKMNFQETAGLPLVGTSAIQALMEHLKLAGGQKILIHGGAGGIGSIAIQIAKHIGAYVATTVSSNDIEYVKGLGADEVIDYKLQHFEELLTNFDAVYDTVGGDTYTNSFKVLKKGGTIVSMIEKPNADLMEQYGVTAVSQSTQITTERLETLAALVDSGIVTMHIEKEFPLDQAKEALIFQQTGHPKGKVILTVS